MLAAPLGCGCPPRPRLAPPVFTEGASWGVWEGAAAPPGKQRKVRAAGSSLGRRWKPQETLVPIRCYSCSPS
eukprot:2714589-Alexandrium_andersonii.AAC.1